MASSKRGRVGRGKDKTQYSDAREVYPGYLAPIITRIYTCALLLLAADAMNFCQARQSSSPKFDKQRFEAYVRYAEGYTASVKIEADDPAASPFPGFQRIVAHVSLGQQKIDRVYYAMSDGQHFVSGNLWNLSESPFLDTLQRLPTNGPAFGPANAKITIVIFSDFQCPYCRQLARTVRDNLPKKYPSEARVIFADFPIDAIHKWARPASEAGHCIGAGNDEAFWAFHDWIFEHQGEVNEKNLREKILEYVKGRGMNAGKISNCLDSHATAREVASFEQNGRLVQVQQTPTLFINGRMLSGAVPWETIDAVIRLELDRPKQIADPPTSTKGCCEAAIPTMTKK